MRVLLALLALAACSSPCPLVCQGDSDCPLGYYCLNNAACLPDCIRCLTGQCLGTVSNCTGCNVACDAGKKCAQGQCADACTGGLSDCGGSCSDLTQDRLNCGACGHACQRDESCKNSACIKVDVCQ